MPILKKINKNFFKKWSPEMAYVLGFFAADGCIAVNKRGGQFWSIQIIDKDILEKIKKILQSEHKINIRVKSGNESTIYRLQIGSIEMCDDLRALGFCERKTKRLVVPSIPPKYFSDFVRGYFDGDGNVWTGYIHKERKTKLLALRTSFTSSSFIFLDALRQRLGLFNIEKGALRKGGGEYWILTYSIHSSLKLFKFMYNANSISGALFLERKRKVFEKYIEMRA